MLNAPAAGDTAGVNGGDTGATVSAAPLLRLEGFEGPLDLLLELARTQKVDLARISILRMVEQYLAVVEATDQVRLELAADWLVMAAWLAWLKSRLLLPRDGTEAQGGEVQEGEAAAGLLAARLAEFAHVSRAAAWLGARDQLGQQVFARGTAEDLTEIDRSGLLLDLPQLLGGYLAVMRRQARKRTYRPRPPLFWTMQEAMARVRLLLCGEMPDGEMPGGVIPDWRTLEHFLPDRLRRDAAHSRARRAAIAGTLLAGLELARGGVVELRQEQAFGDILLRQRRAGAAHRQSELREAAE